MNLYNMLFGINSAADVLLHIIGIDKTSIPRFRDCFIKDGHIVIYTRTGGGNRDFYEKAHDENPDGPWNSNMYENEYFFRTADADYDRTYAYFYFTFPDEYKDELEAIDHRFENYTPSEKWATLIDSFKRPEE